MFDLVQQLNCLATQNYGVATMKVTMHYLGIIHCVQLFPGKVIAHVCYTSDAILTSIVAS